MIVPISATPTPVVSAITKIVIIIIFASYKSHLKMDSLVDLVSKTS